MNTFSHDAHIHLSFAVSFVLLINIIQIQEICCTSKIIENIQVERIDYFRLP